MSKFIDNGFAEPITDIREFARDIPGVDITRTSQTDDEYTVEVKYLGGKPRGFTVLSVSPRGRFSP